MPRVGVLTFRTAAVASCALQVSDGIEVRGMQARLRRIDGASESSSRGMIRDLKIADIIGEGAVTPTSAAVIDLTAET